MPAAFLDTGAFYALADVADRHHQVAEAVFGARAPSGDFVTTDHVFVETWCLIRARLGRPAAMKYWEAMGTGVVRVIGVSSEDMTRARRIADEWPDQDFSLVDCTSFAVIERLDLREAFAFDQHFRVFRFGPGRDQALRLLP